MSTAAPANARKGQEGSRWYNHRPSGEEVAAWFKANVPMAEELEGVRDEFITGVTLIPAKEKSDEVTGFRPDGSPILVERQNLVFTPYIKVETRVAYFWRWMKVNPDWVGVIAPVEVTPVEEQGMFNKHLPPGFFMFPVKLADGTVAHHIGCSMKVTVTDRQSGKPIIDAAPGTKIVPVLGRYGADVNAFMKAETGAIGRALGFAGILVAPGSGIATAEDVQESMNHGESVGVTAETAQLPSQEQPQATTAAVTERDEDYRTKAGELSTQLEREHPEAFDQFVEWAKGRRFTSLDSLDEPQLKGVIRKLEKMLDDAASGAAA